MSVSIKYKGNEIASMSASGTKTLKTAGKYCEGDITVQNTEGGAAFPFETIKTVTIDDGIITFTSTKRYNILLAKQQNGKMLAAVLADASASADPYGLQDYKYNIGETRRTVVKLSVTSTTTGGTTTYTYTWKIADGSGSAVYSGTFDLYGYAW